MENVITSDPYEVVLADLRAKKAQIEQAIVAIEGLRGGGGTPPHAADAPTHKPIPVSENGALLGMSIGDAAKKILHAQRRQMQTGDIVAELERGGVVLNSADKMNTVGSILLRRFYNVGDIVRVARGVWGLQEWYPGRKFSKGKPGEVRDPAGDTKEERGDEPEGNEPRTQSDDFDDLLTERKTSGSDVE